MRSKLFLTMFLTGLFCTSALVAEPVEDAAALYIRAASNGFTIYSPSESALDFNDYPPYPPEWHRIAKAAFEANADRLALARVARTTAPPAKWPGGDKLSYPNAIRSLVSELRDAALYQHTLGNDAEAVEIVRDVLALGRSLRSGDDKVVIQKLLGSGADVSADLRLMVMAPALSIAKTPEAADATHVSPAVLREIIKNLLTPRDVKAEVEAAFAAEPGRKPGEPTNTLDAARVATMLRRAYAEHGLTAMSLACQLYRTDKRAWPASVDQLVPAYLPAVPTDPFGDGKSSLGYVLIKAGLPDGADRPLVYSRGDLIYAQGSVPRDGLFYRLDEPHYGFYLGDGSDLPTTKQKQGGQFRDVALWVPTKLAAGGPKTKKLP